MNKFKRKRFAKALTAVLSVSILCITALFLSGSHSSKQAVKESSKQESAQQTQPALPTKMMFAGENIDLTRSDIRERFDREIISFTYGHTNTLLMIKRANRIFPMVEPILKECNVPDDLKYLMVIESNLDIRAISTAKAAGLWQFIESTGRKHHLEINDNIDERYNYQKATRAACDYLKESYSLYGDWLTTAASYNAGQARISKQLDEQMADNALDLWLNLETSRYIFRILAAKEVLSHPARYGFKVSREDLYPYIPPKQCVTVTSQIDNLALFAQKYRLTLSQLKEANPWLRQGHLQNKTHRTYIIEIPDSATLYYNPSETKVHYRGWIEE